MGLLFPRRDIDGRDRRFTIEELDALAEFAWRLRDLKGAMTARMNAMRRRQRPQEYHQNDRFRPPSGEDWTPI